jgi:protein gp37
MKGKMFSFINKTWNPVAMKCRHDCFYCWAEALKKGRLKDSPRYKDLSEPKLVEKELKRRFGKGDYVFVEDMGDLFASDVPEQWIYEVMKVIEVCPDAKFLLLTKNPARMLDYQFPENVLCGCTIETTMNVRKISKAPNPVNRYLTIKELDHSHKMICIEPIMSFDLSRFVQWMKEIKPELIVIGYDNYNNALPEPSLAKTEKFIKDLRDKGFHVQTKTLREKHD